MPDNGETFVKIKRKTLNNPVVCKDAEYFAVWMYLLLMATHKEIKKEFKGKSIMLQPGQLLTGRKAIARHFNISESKIERILKRFEIEQQIEQQTSTKNRLVTILNWKEHQTNRTTKRTTSGQQVDTYKNDKKIDMIGYDLLSLEAKKTISLYSENFGQTNIGHIQNMISFYGEKLMFDAVNKTIGKKASDPVKYINQICAQKCKYKKDYFLTEV